jgi:hypothetical protein
MTTPNNYTIHPTFEGQFRKINDDDDDKINNQINNLEKYIDLLRKIIDEYTNNETNPNLIQLMNYMTNTIKNNDTPLFNYQNINQMYDSLSIMHFKLLKLKIQNTNFMHGKDKILEYLTNLETTKPPLFYTLIKTYNNNMVSLFDILIFFKNKLDSSTSNNTFNIYLKNLMHKTTDLDGNIIKDLTHFKFDDITHQTIEELFIKITKKEFTDYEVKINDYLRTCNYINPYNESLLKNDSFIFIAKFNIHIFGHIVYSELNKVSELPQYIRPKLSGLETHSICVSNPDNLNKVFYNYLNTGIMHTWLLTKDQDKSYIKLGFEYLYNEQSEKVKNDNQFIMKYQQNYILYKNIDSITEKKLNDKILKIKVIGNSNLCGLHVIMNSILFTNIVKYYNEKLDLLNDGNLITIMTQEIKKLIYRYLTNPQLNTQYKQTITRSYSTNNKVINLERGEADFIANEITEVKGIHKFNVMDDNNQLIDIVHVNILYNDFYINTDLFNQHVIILEKINSMNDSICYPQLYDDNNLQILKNFYNLKNYVLTFIVSVGDKEWVCYSVNKVNNIKEYYFMDSLNKEPDEGTFNIIKKICEYKTFDHCLTELLNGLKSPVILENRLIIENLLKYNYFYHLSIYSVKIKEILEYIFIYNEYFNSKYKDLKINVKGTSRDASDNYKKLLGYRDYIEFMSIFINDYNELLKEPQNKIELYIPSDILMEIIEKESTQITRIIQAFEELTSDSVIYDPEEDVTFIRSKAKLLIIRINDFIKSSATTATNEEVNQICGEINNSGETGVPATSVAAPVAAPVAPAINEGAPAPEPADNQSAPAAEAAVVVPAPAPRPTPAALKVPRVEGLQDSTTNFKSNNGNNGNNERNEKLYDIYIDEKNNIHNTLGCYTIANRGFKKLGFLYDQLFYVILQEYEIKTNTNVNSPLMYDILVIPSLQSYPCSSEASSSTESADNQSAPATPVAPPAPATLPSATAASPAATNEGPADNQSAPATNGAAPAPATLPPVAPPAPTASATNGATPATPPVAPARATPNGAPTNGAAAAVAAQATPQSNPQAAMNAVNILTERSKQKGTTSEA